MNRASTSYGPPDPIFHDDFSDYSDEEGLSDDNEYVEFKKKLKATQKQVNESINLEVDLKKKQLQIVFSAIQYGNADCVFQEIDKGLDVHADLDSGWTPLLLASTAANFRIISGLIERGADVNKCRDDETTPLMLLCNINTNDESVQNNILQCVQLLVENKADVNAIDNKRRTAVMFAAGNGHLEIVKFLLPLVDKEAEDNQRWNILFWAIDGNHLEVVKFLLDTCDFNVDKTDIRGNTALNLAEANNFQQIVELFPKDTVEELHIHLNNNQLNFEETFSNLSKNERPQFFGDVCKMLYGTRSESVLPIFLNNNIGLYEFLSFNQSKLKEIGVNFPYQRNRIMGGIYKFHRHPFKPQSVPFVKKDQLYTNLDVSKAVLTCIKHIIAMEASLKFILVNSDEKLSLPDSKEAKILINKCRQNINRLKVVGEQLVRKTEQWDTFLKPADKITRKRTNITWANLFLVVNVGIISLIILYKFK